MKKFHLQSLLTGAHFALWAVLQFGRYFCAFCFLQHSKAQSYTDLHSASQSQLPFLYVSQRPWLNFEHQLVSYFGTYFSSNLTEQNPYEPRWWGCITSDNTSRSVMPDSPRKQTADFREQKRWSEEEKLNSSWKKEFRLQWLGRFLDLGQQPHCNDS